MIASTQDFLSAVRRAALVAAEDTKGVRFRFTKSGLVLSTHSPSTGEATVNFPCKYDGSDLDIGFNHNYVMDALKVVATDEVTLEMTAPNRPGMIRGGPDFLYVIMPVNLQS
jgi:DNA polymerase-3 subunit beta